MNKKISLPIIQNSETKIMIMGTAPGEESLNKQEYYASKSNRFWRVVFKALGLSEEKMPETYNSKVKCLLKNHIGLWDIYSEFERDGSTDKKIKNAVLNDLNKLNPSIKLIICNGKIPYTKMKMYVANTDLYLLYCYSTSSSHKYASQEQIENDWRKAFFLGKLL